MTRASSVTLRALDGTVRVELSMARSHPPDTLAGIAALSGRRTVAQLLRALRAYCAENDLPFRVVDVEASGWSTTYAVIE